MGYKISRVGSIIKIDVDTWERLKRRLWRLNVEITESPYRERKRPAAKFAKRGKQ